MAASSNPSSRWTLNSIESVANKLAEIFAVRYSRRTFRSCLCPQTGPSLAEMPFAHDAPAPLRPRGQSPKAYLALKPGAPEMTLKELKDFLKSRLGKHEMIQEIEIRASLPRTPVGKLSKKQLYDEINAKAPAEKAMQ
ncbi:MAG: AMP-binding enzyme [Rhizomicrobium sp.]